MDDKEIRRLVHTGSLDELFGDAEIDRLLKDGSTLESDSVLKFAIKKGVSPIFAVKHEVDWFAPALYEDDQLTQATRPVRNRKTGKLQQAKITAVRSKGLRPFSSVKLPDSKAIVIHYAPPKASTRRAREKVIFRWAFKDTYCAFQQALRGDKGEPLNREVALTGRTNRPNGATNKKEKKKEDPPLAPLEGNGAAAPLFPVELNTDAFRAAWAEYVAYRQENHIKPLKLGSVKKRFAEFVERGEPAAIAAINHTIKNGFQGIYYPDRTNENNSSGNARGSYYKPIGQPIPLTAPGLL